MRMMLSEVAEAFGQNWDRQDQFATGVSTDSRSTIGGDLFFALEGDNFDGHDYLADAKSRGAVAAIISERKLDKITVPESEMPTIQVADTTTGLGLLAQIWHQKCETQTIAITGSVGKTTVKEMLSTMLSSEFEICVTQGNFNNLIGLPLTLFRETKDDQIAVIEMGANAKNEISELCDIATPEIGIITQIAEAHLSGFESIEGVANAKSELFASLSDSGTAIINMDSAEIDILLAASEHCSQIKVSVSKHQDSDIWAENISALDEGWNFTFCSQQQRVDVTLNLPGKHNIINALVALAAVRTVTCNDVVLISKLARNLAQLNAVSGRLEVHHLPHQSKIFDDSYNANPTSVKAAIDMLAEQPGQKILVLGDMGELGANEINLHINCGEYALDKKIDRLFCIGQLSQHAAEVFSDKGKTFSNKNDLIEELLAQLNQQTSIVVKGSRSAKMEQVVTGVIKKLPMDSPQKGNLLSSTNRQKNNKRQEQI